MTDDTLDTTVRLERIQNPCSEQVGAVYLQREDFAIRVPEREMKIMNEREGLASVFPRCTITSGGKVDSVSPVQGVHPTNQ